MLKLLRAVGSARLCKSTLLRCVVRSHPTARSSVQKSRERVGQSVIFSGGWRRRRCGCAGRRRSHRSGRRWNARSRRGSINFNKTCECNAETVFVLELCQLAAWHGCVALLHHFIKAICGRQKGQPSMIWRTETIM